MTSLNQNIVNTLKKFNNIVCIELLKVLLMIPQSYKILNS